MKKHIKVQRPPDPTLAAQLQTMFDQASKGAGEAAKEKSEGTPPHANGVE